MGNRGEWTISLRQWCKVQTETHTFSMLPLSVQILQIEFEQLQTKRAAENVAVMCAQLKIEA